ncbi:MAG: leucine-rich repeat domain-containing protein, partial [Anaeroplasmataceae bacterium]|nr:leucine-rich repeat domain-containing protein [Anaeroplasmataceae bacterium]
MKGKKTIFLMILIILFLVLLPSCKKKKNDEHVHEYSIDYVVDVEPSCTKSGSKSRHCFGCDDKIDTMEIPAKGHLFGDWKITKNPTETEEGIKERVCKVCEFIDIERVPVSEHQHNYSQEWTIDKAATCTEEGSKSHHCLKCDDKTDITVIEKIPHDYSQEWTIDKKATCTEEGSKSHHCLVCGNKADVTEIEKLPHNYSQEWMIDEQTSCSKEGSKSHHCLVCGEKTDITVIEKLPHNYSNEWIIDALPNCIEVGSTSRHCLVCNGRTDITAIPALGHAYGKWVMSKEASKTETGLLTRVCERDEEHIDSFELPILNQEDYEYTLVKDANCLEDGLEQYVYEKDNVIFTISRVIKAYGHRFGEWETVIEATETSEGSKQRECSVCGVVEIGTIPVLGHVHEYSTEWTIDIDPTCISVGMKSHHCLGCDDKIDDTEIEMIEHSYSLDFQIDIEATCTEDGSKSYHCLVCNIKKDITKIDALGHFYDEYDICKRCDHIYVDGTEGLIYELNSNHHSYSVIGIGSASFLEDIKIPSKYKGLPVTTIGDSAFLNCDNLVHVELSKNILSIESKAFYDCNHLASIVMLDGLINVEDEAFGYCQALENLDIPVSVQKLGDGAFLYCSSLEDILLSGNMSILGEGVFGGCSNLVNVYFEGSIEEYSLLKFLNLNSNPMQYASHFYLRNSENEFEELTNIVLPNTIVEIGDYQFYGFENITSIVIPNSVESIGINAFVGCDSLESISIPFIGTTQSDDKHFGYLFGALSYQENSNNIPLSLKEVILTNENNISTGAFYGCSNIESITIGMGLTSIGANAFYNCSSLTNIIIPNTVSEIGTEAFYGCMELTSMTIPYVGDSKTNPQHSHFGYLFGSNSYHDHPMKVPATLSEVVITGGSNIADYSFYECENITKIILPECLENIGSEAFYACENLNDIYYEGSVEDWCSLEFYDALSNPMSFAHHFYLRNDELEWEEIINLILPNTIESIHAYQFYGFDSVESIFIPNSIKSIDVGAFGMCDSIVSMTVPFVGAGDGIITHFGFIFGATSYNNNSSFVPATLEEVKIMGGSSIGSNAFYGCESLTTIHLTESIIEFDADAFMECSGLDNIYYNGVIEDWCNITFENINATPMAYANHFYLKNEDSNFEELIEIILPNDVTEVGDYQFSGFNHVTSVNISNYVTQMGFGTFSGCESIISLTIPFLGTTLNDEENPYLGYLFGATTAQDNYRFVPHSLNEVILLGGESIYEASFYGCNFITNISIPMGVTSIGKEAFYNNRGLVDINIPKTIEEIDLDAFYECENLLNVYYEGTLEDWCNIQFKSASTNPMYYALHFYVKDNEGAWKEVTSIVLPDTIEEIGNYQFYGFSSVSSICLSDSVLSIGISAFKGCEQLESFVVPFIGDSIDSLSNTHFGYLFGANNYNEHLTTIPTSLKAV